MESTCVFGEVPSRTKLSIQFPSRNSSPRTPIPHLPMRVRPPHLGIPSLASPCAVDQLTSLRDPSHLPSHRRLDPSARQLRGPWSTPPRPSPLPFRNKRSHRARPQNRRAHHPKRSAHHLSLHRRKSITWRRSDRQQSIDKACVDSHFQFMGAQNESLRWFSYCSAQTQTEKARRPRMLLRLAVALGAAGAWGAARCCVCGVGDFRASWWRVVREKC